MKLIPAQKALRKLARKETAVVSARFFKTGPGEYGEGDLFIGTTVPQTHSVAKQFAKAITPAELSHLLSSPIHEDRLLALSILVQRYEKTKEHTQKKEIVDFYLKSHAAINNWDLVDLSSYKILGHYCHLTQNVAPLRKLSKSKNHWNRRIAIVSTLAFIRKHELELTFEFAALFLAESEDLMHKATGWMLREAGKRDEKKLKRFILRYGKKMPRTMLRYAIEKFSKSERDHILKTTRSTQLKTV